MPQFVWRLSQYRIDGFDLTNVVVKTGEVDIGYIALHFMLRLWAKSHNVNCKKNKT